MESKTILNQAYRLLGFMQLRTFHSAALPTGSAEERSSPAILKHERDTGWRVSPARFRTCLSIRLPPPLDGKPSARPRMPDTNRRLEQLRHPIQYLPGKGMRRVRVSSHRNVPVGQSPPDHGQQGERAARPSSPATSSPFARERSDR